METEVKKKKVIEPWSQRVNIQIPEKQFKRLLKKGWCATVQNYKWYRISKAPSAADIQLFDANQKPVSLKTLKALLRRV